ncbi:hypothetical protein AB0B89_13655 [Sphaerisporangium sp. NPDC049002]|uniref:hypothetical protein n=1 Tax=Sphaerisporangium sp. NPDC049002 TaxID=3155392 RepID=UPI0033D12581
MLTLFCSPFIAPMVVGPGAVPVVTDPAEAVDAPELAVLSAVAHGGGIEAQPVLEALLAALAVVDVQRARLYADFVLMALPEVARKHMEVLMAVGTYEYQSDFAKKYVAEGKAEAIFIILSGRGIPISAETRSRIVACTDPTQLDAWIQRAATAVAIEDLFS